MEGEFLLNIKDLSLEIILIAIAVFGLTMLVKWPIKRITVKFNETKRKAINTVIVFIPMILSLLINVLYSGLFKHSWFSPIIVESAISSYIFAVTIYAIYSRIMCIVSGAKNEKKQNEDYSKETIKYLKNNISVLSKTLKVDEKNLQNVVDKIDNLLKIKDQINSNTMVQDIVTNEKIDNEINLLKKEEKILSEAIQASKEQLINCQNTLNNKGEK